MFEQPQLANLPISAASLSAQDKAPARPPAWQGMDGQGGQGKRWSRCCWGRCGVSSGRGHGRNPQLAQHSPERPGTECGGAASGQPKPCWKAPCGRAGVQLSSPGHRGFCQPPHPSLHPAPSPCLVPQPAASHLPGPIPAPAAGPALEASVAFLWHMARCQPAHGNSRLRSAPPRTV